MVPALVPARTSDREASDADHPKSPRFPGRRCRRPRPRASSAPGHRSPTSAPPEDDHAPAGPLTWHLRRAAGQIAEDLLRAEGFTDIRYVTSSPGSVRRWSSTRRDRLRHRHRSRGSSPSGCRRADHGAGGRASRLLRAVRARAHPHHQRPEGQDASASRPLGLERAPATSRSWRRTSGSTPRRTSTGSPASPGDCHGAVHRTARSMPFSGSRPSRRSCAPARSAA